MNARKKKIVVGGLAFAGVAAFAAVFLIPGDANASENPQPQGNPATSGDGADARQADAIFAVVVAAASTAAVGIVGPAAVPYVGVATPIVVGAWKGLPPKDKAGIWRGDVSSRAAAGAATGAAAGATVVALQPRPQAPTTTAIAPQRAPQRDTALAGLGAFGAVSAATGRANVLQWAVKRFVSELKKAMLQLRNQLCAGADKVYEKLHDANVGKVGLPKRATWAKLSCDQKIAFVAALGPQGMAMLYAGALVGSWAADAQKEFKRYGKAAANVVDKIADAIGGSATKIADDVAKGVSGAASGAADAVKSLFGAPPTMRGQIAGRSDPTCARLTGRMGRLSNLACEDV